MQLQLDVGGTEAVTRAEPRFGIIAFFVATVWEFLQIEWVKFMYERRVLGKDGEQFEHESKPASSKLGISLVLLATSVALYIAGALIEVVYFQSTDSASLCNGKNAIVCIALLFHFLPQKKRL